METLNKLNRLIRYYCHKNGLEVSDGLPQGVSTSITEDGTLAIDLWEIGDKLPQPTMEELAALEPEALLYYGRIDKNQELATKFEEAMNSGHCMSTLGFEINADRISQNNLSNLLVTMDEDATESFRDYNNELHELTKDDVKIIQEDIIFRMQDNYNRKWRYQTRIKAAKTVAALNAIVIDFSA